MTMKKLFATVCASVVLITALCGCSLNTVQTVATPDYAQVTELVTAYEDAYRDYVQNSDGEVMLVTANGVTPLGAECSSKYVKTADGLYESCSLTVQRDVEQHDEYFNIGDGIMLFVRAYVDAAGLIVIQKYYCTSNAVYYINYDAQTLDYVEHIEELDFFVTFDQVRRVYGASEENDVQ